MAYVIPTDLIQQVQLTLRTSAGISSYDPQDPTLPPLPSVDATIAGLDPSPPYLRCHHCKGKLLRGLNSIICVYCGKRHKKDVKPDPIAFNSSLAYTWLLQSLHLDGSEVVGPSSERSDFNRSQNTPKDKICLSELLDLNITWPDEPEEPETIVTNVPSEKSNSNLNLSEEELDDFFPVSERNNTVNASDEQPVFSNQIETSGSNTFGNSENLSLFQDVPSSESGIHSSISASGNSFTGWAADFKSADEDTKPVEPTVGSASDLSEHMDSIFGPTDFKSADADTKSVEPIVGSAVDLSVHMDSIFGHTGNSTDGKLNSGSVPPTASGWIEDEQINTDDSSDFQQAVLFDSVVEAKNTVSSENLGNKSSEFVDDDWFQDTKWQNSTATSETMNRDDDLCGERNNTSSVSPPPLANDWIQDDLLNNTKSSVFEEDEQFKLPVKASDGVSSEYGNNKSSDSVDWFQDTKWPQNSANVMVNDEDDIFGGRTKNDAVSSSSVNDWLQLDLLNNITPSDSQQAEQFGLPIEAKGGMSSDKVNEPSSDSVDWFQDNLWQGNNELAKDKLVKEEDDSYDEWNDFAGSTVNQDSSKSLWNQSGNENTSSSQPKPEISMSSANFQEVDFNGFYQSDPFSGLSNNAIGLGEVNYIQPEVSTPSRTSLDAARILENSEPAEKNADVEMLMSQMHDLSFMLESSLSVPSKPPNGASSFLHD